MNRNSDRIVGRGRPLGRLVLVAAALALALTITVGADVSAQSTDAPRPAESCTARLELGPNPVVFGIGRLVAGRATGLDQSASYNVFLGGTRVGSGVTDETGTAHVNLDIDALTAQSLEVQVVSATRCARAQLVVAGPASIRCTVGPDGLIICRSIELPIFDR